MFWFWGLCGVYGCQKGFCLKCDIKKFFPSINHKVLKEKLSKIFSREIIWLLSVFIDSNGKDSGLPIGNQTSQWFAIVVLNDLDHYIKETLGCKHYVRYMDDLVIIHSSKLFLRKCLQEISGIIKNLALTLNAKTKISKLSEGISFLGFKHIFLGSNVISTLGHSARARLKRGSKKIY